MKTTFLLLAAVSFACSASGKSVRSRTPYAVKDTHTLPSKWKEIGPASGAHKMELRIGLKQDQFHELERHLYEGTTVLSPMYVG